MIYTENNGVRLTRSEAAEIRSMAAEYGHAIGAIKTENQLLESIVKGLSDERGLRSKAGQIGL